MTSTYSILEHPTRDVSRHKSHS